MRKILFTVALLLTHLAVDAQVKTPQPSPKAVVNQVVGLTDVEIEYSRPSSKSRGVFGELVPFNRMWRTGANQNSMITFSEDVTIDGKTLKKGKYAIFTHPKVDAWDVYFYSDTNNWGTPDKWDDSKVALKTTVKPVTLTRNVETFTIAISDITNDSGVLEISWEKTLVPVKFEVPTKAAALASIEKVMAGPSDRDYFSSAQYLYQSNTDMKKALEYMNKAIDLNKEAPFWYTRQKSLIQAKLGDKKGAIETAKASLKAAKAANNLDYVKMNEDSIAEWSK